MKKMRTQITKTILARSENQLSHSKFFGKSALLAGLLASMAFFALTPISVHADESKETEEIIIGTNAAGSFLAARIADAEFDFANAARLLQTALEFQPEEEGLKQTLMITLLKAGEFEKAVELAEPKIRDEASGGIAREIVFSHFIKTKKYNAAHSLLEIAPPSEDMAIELVTDRLLEAWALAGQEMIDEAIAVTDQETSIPWHPLFTNYHAALILEQAGRWEEAADRYRTAIEQPRATSIAFDTVMRAYHGLIRLNISQGEIDDAKIALDQALQLSVNYEPFSLLIEEIEQIELSEEEAPTHIPFMETTQQGVAEVYYTVAKALDRQDNEAYVSQFYQLGIALAPQHALLRLAMGTILENKERFDEANAQYDAISEESPHHTFSLIQKAINLNSADRLEDAILSLNAAIEAQPDNLNAASALSSILMNADRFEEALQVMNKSLAGIEKLQANHWLILYRKGISLDELDSWPLAEESFLKALELAPNQPDVLNYLGYTWVDMGINLEKGLDMLRMAVDMRPNAGYIVDSLGWAHYRLKNYDEAVNYLEQAALLTPTDPTITDHLGDAYWQVNRKLEARYKWGQALELKPDDEQRRNIEEKIENGLKVKFLDKSN